MRGVYPRFVKRALDFLFALAFLLLFSPVYLILILLVRVKLGSPVFFTQERPGLGGRIFRMVKFRSMTDARGADGELLPDAERLTPFGRKLRSTSLDELPEMVNVLRGEMSLIGPRPLLPSYLPLYNDRQAHRHDARPGITGYAQVTGRNAITWEERFEKDVWYVRNCSLPLDLKILWLTVRTVLKRDGISSATSATMEAFAGSPDAPRGRVLILANNASGLVLFRRELLQCLREEHLETVVSVPDEASAPELISLADEIVHTPMSRRGTSLKEDFALYQAYRRLIRGTAPDVVLTYTIKPNVYGGYACRRLGQRYLSTVTGLGSTFQWEGFKKRLITALYRAGIAGSSCVFFQNAENREIFERLGILKKAARRKLVNGSGVNLADHPALPYPGHRDDVTRYVYIGRVMREKGIDEYLAAAEEMHARHGDRVSFAVIGYSDEDYEEPLRRAAEAGILRVIPFTAEILPYYREADAVVLPSYHEGMSNVLMEAGACARPVLASDISGCREIVENGRTGYLFAPRDKEALIGAMERFFSLSVAERARMGIAARKKMEEEFDRTRIVEAYLEEIRRLSAGG